MTNSLKDVLISRDGLTEAEADSAIQDARSRVFDDNEDPETVLFEDFGLEPDYAFDLIYHEPVKKTKHEVKNHLKDLKQVATDLADMPYDQLSNFLFYLGEKLSKDCDKDKKNNRPFLAARLYNASVFVFQAKQEIERAWEICKTKM